MEPGSATAIALEIVDTKGARPCTEAELLLLARALLSLRDEVAATDDDPRTDAEFCLA